METNNYGNRCHTHFVADRHVPTLAAYVEVGRLVFVDGYAGTYRVILRYERFQVDLICYYDGRSVTRNLAVSKPFRGCWFF